MANAGVGSGEYFRALYGSRTWEHYRPILAHILVNSAPGPILDIGAGTGLFVEAAMRWGLDCCGIEGSPEAVALGRQRYPGLHLSQHYLDQPLPFADESFQTAMMHQVIAHLEPDVARQVLGEITRILRPGGLILIFSPSRYDRAVRSKNPDCVAWVHMYSPGELRALVGAAGLRDVVPLDRPRDLLGSSFIGRKAMSAALRLTRWERLSATANSQARKP
jgi:SAM-dependent methyltransferase